MQLFPLDAQGPPKGSVKIKNGRQLHPDPDAEARLRGGDQLLDSGPAPGGHGDPQQLNTLHPHQHQYASRHEPDHPHCRQWHLDSLHQHGVEVIPGFHLTAAVPTRGADGEDDLECYITIHPVGGFTDAVTFSVTGLPPHVKASFVPVTTQRTRLHITANKGESPGNYALTFTGTSGGSSQSITVPFSLTGKWWD